MLLQNNTIPVEVLSPIINFGDESKNNVFQYLMDLPNLSFKETYSENGELIPIPEINPFTSGSIYGNDVNNVIIGSILFWGTWYYPNYEINKTQIRFKPTEDDDFTFARGGTNNAVGTFGFFEIRFVDDVWKLYIQYYVYNVPVGSKAFLSYNIKIRYNQSILGGEGDVSNPVLKKLDGYKFNEDTQSYEQDTN